MNRDRASLAGWGLGFVLGGAWLLVLVTAEGPQSVSAAPERPAVMLRPILIPPEVSARAHAESAVRMVMPLQFALPSPYGFSGPFLAQKPMMNLPSTPEEAWQPPTVNPDFGVRARRASAQPALPLPDPPRTSPARAPATPEAREDLLVIPGPAAKARGIQSGPRPTLPDSSLLTWDTTAELSVDSRGIVLGVVLDPPPADRPTAEALVETLMTWRFAALPPSRRAPGAETAGSLRVHLLYRDQTRLRGRDGE